VFDRLGAQVSVSYASARGDDINADCGATHPSALASIVRSEGADLGLAFDGDGDRVIAVDHTGHVIDGDRLIALSALDRLSQGRLPGPTVVVTVMTNLGFHRALRARGIHVITTAVGDRQVLEAMERSGSALGGEQSGHIIHRDLMPSGDGLLAGALLAAMVRRSGRPLADLAAEVMTTLPQVLVNLRVAEGRAQQVVDALGPDLAAAETQLGDDGRVVLRRSGTEPLVRIMVEAASEEQAHGLAAHLADRARALADCTTT
jgi:phosphoglucosamine mutase